MLSQPYVPRTEELMFASLVLNVPMKDILKETANRTSYLSANQFHALYSQLKIRQYNFTYPRLNAGIYALNDKIIVAERNFDSPINFLPFNATAIACAYMLKKHNIDEILDRAYPMIAKQLSKHLKILYSIREYSISIDRAWEDFRDKMSTIILNLEPIDINYEFRILKGLKKKYGITAEMDSEFITFQFKNIEVGNDVEGRISYKRIDVKVKRENLSVESIEFEFPNGFIYNTGWDVNFFYLHPHISTSGSICYGNQSTLLKNYISEQNLEMFIDLLVETISGYNAGSSEAQPYTSVTNIRRTLSSIDELFKGIEDLSNRVNIVKEIRKAIERGQRTIRTLSTGVQSAGVGRCVSCQGELELSGAFGGFICRNETCISSPRNQEIVACPECEWPMNRTWDFQNLRYIYYCNQGDCIEGPLNINHDGTIPCPACGDHLHRDEDDEFYCDCQEDSIFISGDRVLRSDVSEILDEHEGYVFRRRGGFLRLESIPRNSVPDETQTGTNEVGYIEGEGNASF